MDTGHQSSHKAQPRTPSDTSKLADLRQALENAMSSLEKADICALLMSEHMRRSENEKALMVGREALAGLGIGLPEKPSDADVRTAFRELDPRVGKHLGETGVSLRTAAPEMEAPEKKAAMKLMATMGIAACFHNPPLSSLIFVRMTDMTLRQGLCPESSVAYAGHAKVMAGTAESAEGLRSAYALGLAALELCEKFDSPLCKCRVCFLIGTFLNHPAKHMKWAESVNTEGYLAGSRVSRPTECAAYIQAFGKAVGGFCQGKNLGRLLADLPSRASLLPAGVFPADIVAGHEMVIRNLSGLSADISAFETRGTDEARYLSDCLSRKSFTALAGFHILKAQVLYLYEKYPEALACVSQADRLMGFAAGTMLVPEHDFHAALIMAALCPAAPETEQKRYMEEIARRQARMKTLSDACPENFLHKDLLIRAEALRVQGRHEDAVLLYDKAVESAGENEFIQNEALANELAAKFWLSKGKEEIAGLYMKMARYGYRLWGAKPKADDLERKYHYLLSDTPSAPAPDSAEESPVASRYAGRDSAAFLDMATVIKASQAISGEIVLENLLRKLMDIVMEHAGAERGFLILKSEVEKQFVVESYVSADKYEERLFEPIPVEECRDLCVSVVRDAAQSGRDVVLDNAAAEERLAGDPYVAERKPRSVICVPIIRPPYSEFEHKKGVTGLLYLENNSVSGAFTSDRAEVLRLLSSQAAISIDNARLYKKYHSLHEHAVEGMFQTTPAGRFLSANTSMARIMGYGSPRDLITAVTDIAAQLYVFPEDRESFEGLLREKARVTGFETRMYRKEGTVIWVSVSARAVHDGRGGIVCYEGSLLDITAQKEKKKAEIARRSAEAANQAKSDFLANMSHEIRTPMNAIIGLTDIVLKTELNLKQRNYLNKVGASARALLGIINDILDFSKIEAGRLDVEKREFQLQRVLEEMADLFLDQAAEKGLDLLIARDKDVPSALIGDPLRLRQILINLTGNAVKFTKEGKILIRIACAEKRPDRAVLSFSVEDTGMGISPENMGKLFSAFTQAEESVSREYGGTGLGLAICKRLTDLMGGDIRVESLPGKGSTFSFDLPFDRQAQEKEPAYRLVSELCGLRVMIADHDEIGRQMIRDIMPFGVDTESAGSGEEALELLEKGIEAGRPCQLLVMDGDIPDIGGLGLLRGIRGNPRLAHIPVVMITAFDSEREIGLEEDSGADALLLKPLKESVLLDTLLEVFKIRDPKSGLPGPDSGSRDADSGLRGMRVLLVEDNPINQEVASAILGNAGFEVETAENGRAAVRAVTGMDPDDFGPEAEAFGRKPPASRFPFPAPPPYDAVLMDIRMPEMNGFEATKAIRRWETEIRNPKPAPSTQHPAPSTQHPETRNPESGDRIGGFPVPIIAMTAHAMKGIREKCLDAGMNDYVSKPVDSAELVKTLKKWTGRSPAPHGRSVGAEDFGARNAGCPSPRASQTSPIFRLGPAINVEEGLRRLNGNERLFLRLLKNFVSNYSGMADEVRDALDAGNRKLARHLLHKLKGMAGNLSATGLYLDTEALEFALEEKSPAEIGEALRGLEGQLGRVVAAVREVREISEPEEDAPEDLPEPEGGDPSDFVSTLRTFAGLLAENNIESENLLGHLKAHFVRHDAKDAYLRLETLINRFDFKNARHVLAEALESMGISV